MRDRRITVAAAFLVVLGLACVVLVACPGCSVGRGADGTAVIGFPAGWHPDTDALAVGAGTIGTMLFGPAGGAAAASTVAAIAGALGWRGSAKRAAEEARRAERLSGREEGWDERERAAGVQQPIGVPVGGGVRADTGVGGHDPSPDGPSTG